MEALLFVLLLLVATFLAGRAIERNHLAELARRETDNATLSVTNAEDLPEGYVPAASTCCSGSVVMGTDYFRRFAAKLKGIVGGRIGLLDRILMRARREAVARMLEQARAWGADAVINVRVETATIGRGQGKQGLMVAEVFAYGTAVRRRA